MKIKQLQSILDQQPSVSGNTYFIFIVWGISWLFALVFLLLGIGLLLESLLHYKIFLDTVAQKLHLVLGFNGDKKWSKMINQLAKLKPTSVAATRFTCNFLRKVAYPRIIAKKIQSFVPNLKTKIFLDPIEALDWSKKQAKNNDIILVTGSLFLSGEIKNQIS